MHFEERWYQVDCANALFEDVNSSSDIHPVAGVPTGGGKTIILCKFIDLYLSKNPLSNILVLCDDARILEQNTQTLENYFDGIDIGLYSSGLDSQSIEKITVAGIQSIYRKYKEFKKFDIIIIDECHKVNTKQKGMYRNFLEKVGAIYIGLTATPFRTGHGYIHEGEGGLFNKLSYNMLDTQIYNRIVSEGYLKPLYSYPTALKLSGEGCRTTAGDWNEKDLSEKNDREELTTAAVMETKHYGKKYHHWLIFAIDIQHCDNIVRILKEHGISAIAIHSKTPNVNDEIKRFKKGVYQAAVHVNMLTTGFDFPAIDLIADLRPTKSPIVHVQGKGRGARPFYNPEIDVFDIESRLRAIEMSTAPHCLVLDFAGNVERLGPINRVVLKQKSKKEGSGEAVTKNCPECKFINWGGAKHCENCGCEFVIKEKLTITASSKDIIAKDEVPFEKPSLISWQKVDRVEYSRYTPSSGKGDMMSVEYKCGLRLFREYIGIDRTGYARHTAKNWIKFRWNRKESPPDNLDDLLDLSQFLLKPTQIQVDDSGKYTKIMDVKL